MNPSFSDRLTAWQRAHGRHGLPWQSRNPYHIWLSEIMLQQTQVSTVAEYYPRFLAAFPTVERLAAAGEDEVLNLWAGLGYYSRARNLHRAAGQIMRDFGGRFPQTRPEWETLAGVGRSTAAAVTAFAFDARETILDGNVKRVLCRVFALDGSPDDRRFEQSLWRKAESLLPERPADMPAYTQGLMDLGATVCRRSRPACGICPMDGVCEAQKQNLTAVLPRKKTPVPTVNLPLFWLVVRCGGAVWLEKRPAKGIWAGLYCVPCFDGTAQLYEAAARFGLQPEDMREMPAFVHRLTHRILDITPFAAEISRPPPLSDGRFVPPAGLSDYGLPKPLARLLAHM